MTNTECPACKRLPSVLKCNAHRTESISAGVIRKARAQGYTGTNPLEAETFIGARPVVIG
jgi:hypothetical protein